MVSLRWTDLKSCLAESISERTLSSTMCLFGTNLYIYGGTKNPNQGVVHMPGFEKIRIYNIAKELWHSDQASTAKEKEVGAVGQANDDEQDPAMEELEVVELDEEFDEDDLADLGDEGWEDHDSDDGEFYDEVDVDNEQSEPEFQLETKCPDCQFRRDSPRPIYGSSICPMVGSQEGTMVTWGGTNGFYDGMSRSLHVSVLSKLRRRVWFKLFLCPLHKKSIPSPRYKHAVVNLPDGFLVVGGSSISDCVSFKTVHSFCFSTLLWTEHKCEPNAAPMPASPPSGSSSNCVAPGSPRVGNGNPAAAQAGQNNGAINMNIDEMEDEVIAPVDDAQMKPDHLEQQQGYPGARRSHSCVLWNNSVYMLAGFNDRTHVPFDDFWRLDLASYRWHKLHTSFYHPISFHTAVVTPAGCMYVYGGTKANTSVRLDKLCKIWLTVPPLKELSRSCLFHQLDDQQQLNVDELNRIGVPRNIVQSFV